MKSFSGEQKLRKFIAGRSTLQEMLKYALQGEGI